MKIKNWNKFQHFKDRRPPWIKLHKEILEQRDISMISDCSFRVLVGLWLIASEDDDMEGNLPSVDDIAFKLRMDKSKLIKTLSDLDGFLIQDDIKVISDGCQVDDPEERREEESRGEEKSSPSKIPNDWNPNETNLKWMEDAGLTGKDQVRAIRDFKDFWKLSEGKKSNWDLAFRKNPIVKQAVNLAEKDKKPLGGNEV